MIRNGTIKHVPCSYLAAWVCKRDVGKIEKAGIPNETIGGNGIFAYYSKNWTDPHLVHSSTDQNLIIRQVLQFPNILA